MAKVQKKGVTRRRREKKNIERGAVHISSTFNNTIVTITDVNGNAISWASSGGLGFRGSRKSTPYAAQTAAETAARAAMEHGLKSVEAVSYTHLDVYKRQEPYKGKGIKYDYEVIRRKEGKAGKKA